MMPRLLKPVASFVVMLAISACGQGADAPGSPTGPSNPAPSPSPNEPVPSTCAITATNVPSSVPSGGGQYTFTLTTGANCAWTARSDATWADVAPSSGQGSATPALRVTENPRTDDTRTLTLTINTQSFRVTQVSTSCSYTLSTYGLVARNEGGRLELRVNTTAGCAWSATTGDSWIAITPRSGSGSDYVYLDISPNPGDARQGTVTIAGQRVNVTQPRG